MKEQTPPTQFVSVHGITMAYQDWPGKEGPLLCIPSITGQKGSFRPLAGQLSPRYRVLALDLRGRGESDKPASGYGFAYHARDILGFADALHLESFVLVGHSFGATTSSYTASIRPDRVSALILLDGGSEPGAETLKQMYPAIKRLEKTYPSMEEYLAVQRSVVYHKPWTRGLEQCLSDEMERQPDGTVRSRSSASAITHDLDMHFLYTVFFHLPELKCPVLLLRPAEGLLGTTGHVYSEHEAAAIVSRIPRCRFETVQGGNHYTILMQDNPPVTPFIKEFLGQILTEPPL